ncbi:hypothetical protein YPPY60_0243, partial [Yersinia pestis PY-60]
MDEPGDP